MEKIRVIGTSTPSRDQEEVNFTTDFDSPATDFARPGWVVDYDEIIDDNLPTGFPYEYTLVVSH